MLITVVIPVYNGVTFIRRAIDSVLAQTFTDFELIVVDDGSTDGSGDLVQKYRDPRLQLITQSNAGVSAARNRGIHAARGEYVAFLDADDEWDREFLEVMFQLSREYPQAGIFGSGYRLMFPQGRSVEVTVIETRESSSCLIQDYFHRALGGCIVHASGIMIPRRIFSEAGEFPVGVKHGEDLDMWARIAARYPIGYNTSILLTFHQTYMNFKPRMQSMPVYAPLVQSLSKILSESTRQTLQTKFIRSYIRYHIVSRGYGFVYMGNRPALLNWLAGNQAVDWVPTFTRIAAQPICWPLLRIWARIDRFQQSRLVLALRGGERISHGVLYKLSKS